MASTPVIVIGKPLLKTYRGYRSRKERFDDWRAVRPFWGGVLMMAAGLLLAYIPFYTLDNFAFTGGTAELIGIIGLVFAFFVFLSGVASLTHPQISTLAGMTGIIMSILSIVGGTFGGMGIGTFLGMVGGSLCVAWIQEEETVTLEGEDEAELREKAQKYEELLEQGDVDPSELSEEELDKAVEGIQEEDEDVSESDIATPDTPEKGVETDTPAAVGATDTDESGSKDTEEPETPTVDTDTEPEAPDTSGPETSDTEIDEADPAATNKLVEDFLESDSDTGTEETEPAATPEPDTDTDELDVDDEEPELEEVQDDVDEVEESEASDDGDEEDDDWLPS